jgi:hypothetical protein
VFFRQIKSSLCIAVLALNNIMYHKRRVEFDGVEAEEQGYEC